MTKAKYKEDVHAFRQCRACILVPLLLMALMSVNACELDNYDAPDAQLAGSFIDSETGELVEQDIIRGSQIELIEHGYDPVAPQYLRVRNDGTYENNLLFSNTYTIQPVRGNFLPVEPEDIFIGRNTRHDFYITPYLRILDPHIEIADNRATATFRIQQNSQSRVRSIGLFVDTNPNVGEPMRTMATTRNLNRVVDEQTTHTLTMNLLPLQAGRTYFFRIGALISESEAKYNYAPAVRIDL